MPITSLSLGFEFELIATRSKSDTPLPEQGPAQLRFIADALDAGGFHVAPFSGISQDGLDYGVWNLEPDISIEEWSSGSDRDDTAPPRFGFQLISPVYYTTPLAEPDWSDEIMGAIALVNDLVVLKANKSTGLHVHIGQGNEGEFPLETLKRLMLIFCKYERESNIFRLSLGRNF